ncbi:unnamed protein product [Zymoseptoria tritici ST99CH_3D1]|nr:unnamed protein product [Zymoseptoria tritici ST99CH_3D1]
MPYITRLAIKIMEPVIDCHWLTAKDQEYLANVKHVRVRFPTYEKFSIERLRHDRLSINMPLEIPSLVSLTVEISAPACNILVYHGPWNSIVSQDDRWAMLSYARGLLLKHCMTVTEDLRARLEKAGKEIELDVYGLAFEETQSELEKRMRRDRPARRDYVLRYR